MIAALPLSVSAAGEYVPGNPRWSGYQNQVQWDRPAGAASGDSFEYEAQLLLGDDVVESKAVEIDTYLFFTNDVVTRPQEEYTIRVRARWIMIVGDPDGQYMVADVGEAEPPHEHSYTQKHDAAQHWQACSCGDKKDAADHSFGAWTADGNTESRICTVCGYAETRDAAQTSATGETTDNGQDTGGEGIAELTDENTGVSVSLSEAVPEGVELYAGVMEAESLLEEKPELKEALDGLLSVYEIIPDAQCCCSDRYRRGGADGRKYDRCHAGAAWMRLGPVHYFCQYESDPDCSGKFIFSKSDINFFHNYTGSVHGCLFTDSL